MIFIIYNILFCRFFLLFLFPGALYDAELKVLFIILWKFCIMMKNWKCCSSYPGRSVWWRTESVVHLYPGISVKWWRTKSVDHLYPGRSVWWRTESVVHLYPGRSVWWRTESVVHLYPGRMPTLFTSKASRGITHIALEDFNRT